MGINYGAGRRNREIFSSTPTPFQIIGCIVLLVVLFVIIARYADDDTTVSEGQLDEGETADSEGAVNNAITGDVILEGDQEESNANSDQTPSDEQPTTDDTPPVTLPEISEDVEMPSTPLVGADVEAAEDTFSYSSQCTEAITTSKSEIAAVKVNIEALEAEAEAVAQSYINAKKSMYAAIHDLSVKREKLLSVKGICQETGIPPG